MLSEQANQKVELATPAGWRDEIAGYVFELLIGISRLMELVQPPPRPRGRAAGAKRASRRKAA